MYFFQHCYSWFQNSSFILVIYLFGYKLLHLWAHLALMKCISPGQYKRQFTVYAAYIQAQVAQALQFTFAVYTLVSCTFGSWKPLYSIEIIPCKGLMCLGNPRMHTNAGSYCTSWTNWFHQSGRLETHSPDRGSIRNL